ncbi:YitT family protein [Clostridium fallax]|uniref:Uncharacterized membrane-anchored protein YitT, contains DUF161 and DUF2179 domains n=1 Tax=Clostridium fallax TaxID=1533 RepID=A0A1M4VMK0_9CLOT|nr:YitT family protein [Clostridium fallax]SHE70030.1 Uncharacterized membrane-anchored protein YitT, contains DUF161 and DUF2179 domains [Clostridium fallax]SQB22791.1 membrane protein [Clostridium fallax]
MIEKLKEFLIITVGFILVAIAVQYFYVPNNITGGGITGIAMVVCHYFPSMSMGVLMTIMNIVLFAIAFVVLGSGFGAKTLYAAFGLSFTMTFMEKYLNIHALTSDVMLASIIGTLLLGSGLGMVFTQNASTGGTDIIAKIINKFFHINMGKCMQSVDIIVVMMIAVAFGISSGLYAVVCVLLNGIIIDKVIEGFSSTKQVMIITNRTKEIRNYITSEINRGCTIVKGEGGYTGHENKIIYCVMDRHQLVRLRKSMKEIDEDAFIIVNDAHEVLGTGFKDVV